MNSLATSQIYRNVNIGIPHPEIVRMHGQRHVDGSTWNTYSYRRRSENLVSRQENFCKILAAHTEYAQFARSLRWTYFPMEPDSRKVLQTFRNLRVIALSSALETPPPPHLPNLHPTSRNCIPDQIAETFLAGYLSNITRLELDDRLAQGPLAVWAGQVPIIRPGPCLDFNRLAAAAPRFVTWYCVLSAKTPMTAGARATTYYDTKAGPPSSIPRG